MNEQTLKLELKEGISQTQTEELAAEEENYKQLTESLKEIKEIKVAFYNEIKLARDENT